MRKPVQAGAVGAATGTFLLAASSAAPSGAASTSGNAGVPSMDANSNSALIQDLKNAGAKVTGVLATGLEPTVVGSPSWTALPGSCFFQAWVPAQLHTEATERFQSAFQKSEHIPTKTFPDRA